MFWNVAMPITSSAVDGFVVPMPTLPPDVIVSPVTFVAEKAVSVIRKTSDAESSYPMNHSSVPLFRRSI